MYDCISRQKQTQLRTRKPILHHADNKLYDGKKPLVFDRQRTDFSRTQMVRIVLHNKGIVNKEVKNE